MPGRTIAISDIHGCFTALDLLLRKLAPTQDDLLVVLGDVIDRGPDSRSCIDRLLEDGREFLAAGRLTLQAKIVPDLKPVPATLTTRDMAEARARISGTLVTLAVREALRAFSAGAR